MKNWIHKNTAQRFITPLSDNIVSYTYIHNGNMIIRQNGTSTLLFIEIRRPHPYAPS